MDDSHPDGELRPWILLKSRGKEAPIHLLSHEIWVVGCLHLERAVRSPEIDRNAYASTSPFVNLDLSRQLLFSQDKSRRESHSHTISADSGPAILNSISAYFFQ